MRILLTGRNGQLGFELRRILPTLGDVITTDRSTLDITDVDAMSRVTLEAKPHVIVNAAAYTAVDKAETEPDVAMRINGCAPGVLADLAKRVGALLVHFSTDYIFDGDKTAPYSEGDVPNPLNTYGRSKLEGERAIVASGCRHLTLRTSWVYGARGRNFLLTMLRLSRERRTLQVVDDQFGAPTWCRDIAEATAQLLRSPECPMPGAAGIFHLCAAGFTSWYGFACRIFSSRELVRLSIEAPTVQPICTDAYPTLARRPRNSRLDCTKLAEHAQLRLPFWFESLDRCMAEVGAPV
jgi:dTDP-4-dehydrorhamnose reductase